MSPSRSLMYPVVGFLMLVVLATLSLGYAINYTILKDVLHDKVSIQANDITNKIQKSLNHKIEQVTLFKESWMKSMSWLWMVDDNGNTAPMKERWNKLERFLPFWKVDYLLLLDGTGQIGHHLPSTLMVDRTAGNFSLYLQQAVQAGQQSVAIPTTEGWGIHVVAPLPGSAEQAKHMVFGYRLETLVNQIRKEYPESRFLLVPGAVSQEVSGLSIMPTPIDPNWVKRALETQNPQLAFDATQTWNLYYTPITLLERSFCLVLAVDLELVRTILANSRQQLLFSLLFMLVILALTAWGLNRMLLAPLRKLHEKATVMAEICSEEDEEEESPAHGNEVVMLEHVMQVTSQKLYAHLSGLRESKQLLEGLALKDPITELLNRRMFVELLGRALQHANRNKSSVSVLIMAFQFGQKDRASDGWEALLKQTAIRLKECLRGEDLAFRIGEDTFSAFIPEYGNAEALHAITERILQSLALPVEEAGQQYQLTTRMGVSLYPDHGDSVETLISRADEALQAAKEMGGNGSQLFGSDPF